MHKSLLPIALSLLAWSSLVQEAAAVSPRIPKTNLDSQKDFEAVWNYNYPWGTDHNGAARMDKSQLKLEDGTLTVTAKRVSGQKPARHGGKDIAVKYLSGAIHAKEHFAVTAGGGYDFSGDFKATTARGTWPAFWLTGIDVPGFVTPPSPFLSPEVSAPPANLAPCLPSEVDMAEWKGSGKISFNTFNTSSQVAVKDVSYPAPADFHGIRCELRDVNGRDVSVKFYMDGSLVTTQMGRNFVGKPFYL